MQERKQSVPRYAIVCETPFQLLNAINYQLHQEEFPLMKGDLFILRSRALSSEVINRVRDNHIFDSVFTYSYENNKTDGFSRRFSRLFGGKDFIGTLLDEKITTDNYNLVYAACPTEFNYALTVAYPDAKVRLYDDGSGSYVDNIPKVNSLFRNLPFWKIGRGSPWNRVECLYVNNPSMCESSLTKDIRGLTPLSEISEASKQIIQNIFGYTVEPLYTTRRLVILSLPKLTEIRSERILEESEKVIAHQLIPFSKEALVRLHPRLDSYYCDGFDKDSQNNLWELTVENQITEDHILLSSFSTAQMIPKFIFDKEPWLIFTFEITEKERCTRKQQRNNHALVEKLKKSYHTEKIFSVRTYEELNSVLNQLLDR